MRRHFITLALLVAACGLLAGGGERPAHGPAVEPDYEHDVKPLLNRCYACHSALRQKGKLRLETVELMRQGGRSGPAIVAGKSGESRLIDHVIGRNGAKRMPPEGDGEPLSKDQIALLAAWIDGGAKAPRETAPEDPRKHWAFQTPVRPDVPKPVDSAWGSNPIDAFVAIERERRQLKPRPAASKSILLRRVYVDLIGLPPTRQELHDFLADTSADAYEKVVDKLLADPRYGERWGRHWMDVWRYSDWTGYNTKHRDGLPHVWRWRDWIVESLNADKGYDRMLLKMLAGDETAPTDPATLRATGLLARNWYNPNRQVTLQNIVEHTSKAFLGLTLNCARCHDHKYDPIAQQEYYRFRAVFEPHHAHVERWPGKPDLKVEGLARVFDLDPYAPTFLFERGNDQHADRSDILAPGVPAVLAGPAYHAEPVNLKPAGKPQPMPETTGADLSEEETARLKELDTSLAEARHAALLVTLRVMHHESFGLATANADNWKAFAEVATEAQRQQTVRATERDLFLAECAASRARQKAGADAKTPDLKAADARVTNAKKRLTEAQAALKAPKSTAYTKLTPDQIHPPVSSGRRLALARWLGDRQNPLAARVAVNHIWLRHFGRGLVSTEFNFGLSGRRPTHPALLDWLAVEFMEQQWSMKKLHRLIVTSETYRMESSDAAAGTAKDPENEYLWRMNPRRMEAEVVRDSVLFLAGQLDPARGGPEIDHKLGQTNHRRSLYFRQATDKQMEFTFLFDGPRVVECYRRRESVIPQQALALENSPLVLEQSRLLARQLSKDAGEKDTAEATRAFITAAFEQILGRLPVEEERSRCEEWLAKQAGLLKNPKELTPFAGGQAVKVPPAALPHLRAREGLIQVLFNHHDFVTVR